MRTGSVIAIIAGVGLSFVLAGSAIYVTQQQTSACLGGAVMGAKIGGPMTLHDSAAKPVTEKDILSGATLVYFGYANCPDVCPVDNARNDQVADLLAAKGVTLTPIFISVDPTRDTPEVLANYESAFTHLKTYTGTAEEVDAAVKAWKVYYEILPADLAKYQADPSTFYTVNHTTMTYLAKPGGDVVAVFQRENTAEEIAQWAPCYLSAS
ncbi:SCO family protein [Rhodobacter sp. KR11]|jgi:protein SCO1/2|uniref:SCO family protein n=1 Tax=Rhodobacter sp. KR11 TaxID=2974588 RepID=UPI002222A4CE|nr:SCO family protein [Rhodobacter sp. KR11]MCW1918877.1 SCO family protein [Rhodobacter sp. KR11]